MTDKPVVGSSKTVAESLELASIYRRAPEQQRGGYEQHIVDLADEVGRLRAVVWQIKGTAKEYSGDLALEVTRLCVRALVGVAHETCEQLPDAWLVLEEDGYRYLSGGEGQARERLSRHGGILHPLYRSQPVQRTDHAENLAKALEHYLSAHDTLSAVQDSDEVAGLGDASDCGFHDAANDAWRAMRTALYEYRKRHELKANDIPCAGVGSGYISQDRFENDDGAQNGNSQA